MPISTRSGTRSDSVLISRQHTQRRVLSSLDGKPWTGDHSGPALFWRDLGGRLCTLYRLTGEASVQVLQP